MKCDILVVGGGLGGVSAALAAARMGANVVLTEETDVLGGQLTAQAVPPDEHPWIESFGSNASYRALRASIRDWYRKKGWLKPEVARLRNFNPGGGWVSKLCHLPQATIECLETETAQYPNLKIFKRHKPFQTEVSGDSITSVTLRNLETGGSLAIEFQFVLDATELGDLLAISNTEYRVGQESQSEFGEPDAPSEANSQSQQAITWIAALGAFETPQPAQKPDDYERWRSLTPSFWCGPLLSFTILHPITAKETLLPLYEGGGYELFSYRQIVNPEIQTVKAPWKNPVTIVNWPQNDYFEGPIIDCEESPQWDHPEPGASGPVSAQRLKEARDLTCSLVYWLQTEAPRHDGGAGYAEVGLVPEILGTDSGLARYPYIRESRRIVSLTTLTQLDLDTRQNPLADRVPPRKDSVGVGAYRIDLHPRTSGIGYLDVSSLPFQIPIGCLVPVRVNNLLAAAKNIGVTHIANGATRLHPVEWGIGEAAGILAAYCLEKKLLPRQVCESIGNLEDYQAVLASFGVETTWPSLKPL